MTRERIIELSEQSIRRNQSHAERRQEAERERQRAIADAAQILSQGGHVELVVHAS